MAGGDCGNAHGPEIGGSFVIERGMNLSKSSDKDRAVEARRERVGAAAVLKDLLFRTREAVGNVFKVDHVVFP